MINHEEFLKAELDMGISAGNPDFVKLAEETVKQLTIQYQSVLDYGAGVGVYSDAFHRAGKEVKVFELWKPHREYIARTYPSLNIVDRALTTDLMAWIEVAEHMTDEQINRLMYKIKPTYILFSSTSQHNPEFDEFWGHINIKSQEDWIALFKGFGYKLSEELKYPTNYSKLFKRIQ